ncbi:MAG: hypothetical protein WAR83_09335 [Flavobacteriales bacterium]
MSSYHYRKHRLPDNERSTFRNGLAQRMVVSPGVELYRVITPLDQFGNGNHVFGKYWFSRAALTQLRSLMQLNDCTFEEAARAKLAVNEVWNPKMSHLCKIRMQRTAFVWRGSARCQHKLNTQKKVAYIGDTEQIYIPHIPIAKANDQGDRPLSELATLIYNRPLEEVIRSGGW